ncbi:stage II sporulation protein M [Aquirufa antheringensis]|jgi:uncharacterized membrane protein SpoIIM required for sporulation|uniref:Stage II sporulation protein M n=1 Tax=Aquirufa antheringensis TaxID=2516559 RepID=A0A4Q9BGX2_9BACT|nr:stage II sporulation protein M [Aquirufa antheringensis]MCE4217872.1 hypothetical protein [Pseudarcicella sp. GAP-15]MCZ2485052.1 stage II sporulation protein M [Aquirufa antheringensis]TBH75357.1 stage II sporulation protein M [Aquirufa antheringensis]
MFLTFQFNKTLLLGFVGLAFYIIGFQYKLPLSEVKETYLVTRTNVDHWELFFFLFLTNLRVGLLIVVFGFITGGLASIIVFGWNAFSLGLLINSIFSTYKNPFLVLQEHLLPHATTEIAAFYLYACVGLEGYHFFKKMVANSEFTIELIPSPRFLIIPSGLLVISALIESFISS